MNGWLKSVRPRIVVMAGILCLISFKVSCWNANAFLAATFIVVAASATMAQNDWRDRFQDVQKGKDFVLKQSKAFFRFAVLLWIASSLLAFCLWLVNPGYGILSLAIIASGLIYSETRRIPLLPSLLVAIASASPAIYPIFLSPSKFPWLLFAAAAFSIFGREILKDLDDLICDRGYKWTLPIALGARLSKIVAGLFFLPVCALAYFVSPLTLVGVPPFLFSVIILFRGGSQGRARAWVDIAMSLILVSLVFA